MTTLLVRTKDAKRAGGPLHTGLPQVNLLPPEVRAARALRHVKQWLVVVLLLVLAVAGVGYAFALVTRGAADNALADAQVETAKLQAQEKKYAPVQPVLTDLKRTGDARSQVMAPEIQWKSYLDAIAAVLPENVSIKSISVTQESNTAVAPAPSDTLTDQGVATVQFSARAKTLPDSSAWTDALNSIPGFYAASTTSDTLTDENDVVSYTVTSMVQVNLSALANRFPADATTNEGS